MMQVAVLTTWEAVSDISADWNTLLAAGPANSVFLTWEWMQAWSEVTHQALAPVVVTVRDEDENLVAIAPFWRTVMKVAGIRFRVLRFMGDTATGQEYPDIIVSAEAATSAPAAVWEALVKVKDVDLVWLPRVSGWSGAISRLRDAAVQAGFRSHSRGNEFSAFALPDTLSDYEAMLSSNRRQQMRRNARKVFGGEVQFDAGVDAAGLDELLDDLFRLHRARWLVEGEPGSFVRRPLLSKFYRAFATRVVDRGWLGVFTLKEGDEMKAIQYGYLYGEAYHQMQEGYDPDYVDGAGNALRYRAIEDCIEKGIRAYDFLGVHTEHKRRWGAEVRGGYDVFLGRPTMKTLPLFLRPVWPTGRFINDLSDELVTQAGDL